jgi:hypothetical protein
MESCDYLQPAKLFALSGVATSMVFARLPFYDLMVLVKKLKPKDVSATVPATSPTHVIHHALQL